MFDTGNSDRSIASGSFGDVEIVTMPEKATQLNILLHRIRPSTTPPRITSANDLPEALLALVLEDKYDVPTLPRRMGDALTILVLGSRDCAQTAFRVYCIPSRYELEQCARDAAFYALSIPFAQHLTDLPNEESRVVIGVDLGSHLLRQVSKGVLSGRCCGDQRTFVLRESPSLVQVHVWLRVRKGTPLLSSCMYLESVVVHQALAA